MLSTNSVTVSDQVQQEIAAILSYKYVVHPFASSVTAGNLEQVLTNYCAMSEAFPFLQAGSQKELIFDCIRKGTGVDVNMELTSVVGNFLCWDESGGHYVLLRDGMPGLSKILNTSEYYHANLLKKDIHKIFGRDLFPFYSTVTQEYLGHLYDGFASLSPIVRCASMVAYEAHASQMISALWDSVAYLCGADRDELFYFKVHVGGDDPAESYHLKMTSKMIEKIISPGQISSFIEAFDSSYNLSYSWCNDITKTIN
jgi:hypothetical protein